MADFKLEKQDIINALKYIDENVVPGHNTSVGYDLVIDDGKKYPPKYVLAVADHLANGDITRRSYSKGERKNSNQTMPRIACQVFEKQIVALSVEDKESFPVCKYKPDRDMIRGIYSSVDEFRKYHNTIEYMTYSYDNGRQLVIYCWNIFSTIIFVQECLKRFGEQGDEFILIYRAKDGKEAAAEAKAIGQNEPVQQFKCYLNPYSSVLESA